MDEIFIKPIAWSIVKPSASTVKNNSHLPSIQIFGYTQDNRTIYVRIPRKLTFIIKFSDQIDDEIELNMSEILSPSSMKVSSSDASVLIVRTSDFSPMELTEDLATWIDIKQDPYGELESFWESRDIGPYEWLVIRNPIPLPGKYTNCNINIRTEEEHVFSVEDQELFPSISSKLLYWDIEVLSNKSDEFPNSSDPLDIIFMISIITASGDDYNGYVVTTGNVDLVPKRTDDTSIIKAINEEDLINKFFTIFSMFNPDRQIYYNGDMFDMPYLIDRLRIYNMIIPKISKISSLTPKVITHSYPSPFGREDAKTINIPGIETIDLIHYYRRFYPYYRNHKLDTIAKLVTGEGKTELSIEDMMNIIRNDDQSKISDVINYSYTDSLKMVQLWNTGDVEAYMEAICNNLSISTNILLRYSVEGIINRSAYNIDPGTVFFKGKYDSPSHLKEATKGIYRDVYIYDYSELYRQIMLTSEQLITITLAERLEDSPGKLITTAFYSPYSDRNELLPRFNDILNEILGTNMIIAIEAFMIRSIGPLNHSSLRLLDVSQCYVSVSKASFIILDEDEMEAAGLSKLCRPKFELASDVIRQYLSLIYLNELNKFLLPDMRTLPLSKFILSEKISNNIKIPENVATLDTYNSTSIKYNLLLQHGLEITTWVSVKYIMSMRGPLLLSLVSNEDEIDYNYYTLELNKYIKDLQNLKVYGK